MARAIFQILFFLIISLFCSGNGLSQQIGDNNQESLRQYHHLKFELLLHKNQFYYKERIIVRVRISNQGDNPILIFLHDEWQTTFKIVMRTLSGQSIRSRVPWILASQNPFDKSEKDPFYRKGKYILLHAEESFTRELDLQQLFDVDKGNYEVQAFFYPDIFRRPEQVVSAPHSQIIRTTGQADDFIISQGQSSGQTQAASDIQADEIVFLHLKAEIEKQWDRFIKFVDLQSYIQIFDAYYRRYQNANAIEKREVLEDFRRFLTRNREDYLLDFKILRILYEGKQKERAIVLVYVRRFGGAYPDNYIYSYKLHRSQSDSMIHWCIYELQVTRTKQMDIGYY